MEWASWAAAAGNGGAVEVCTLPNGHSTSGSVKGSAGSGPDGGSGGDADTGTGTGGGGGGGYFGGGGGAGGDTEVPCASAGCFHSGGQGGAAGSSFVTSSAQAWSPFARTGTYKLTVTSPPTVTVQPVIGIEVPGNGAAFAQGSAVTASWSCAQFVTAVNDHQVCSSTVPSGGKLDTKTVGKHVYVVQDGNVSATVDYAIIASCSQMSGAKLRRCRAQGAYFKALAACGPGTSPAALACAAKAKAAYKRSLAKSR